MAIRADIFACARNWPIAILVLLSFAGAKTHAQSGVDPDWPCVQRLVPEVSASVIWPGPPPESLNRRWRDAESIADLVGRLTSRRTTESEAHGLIAEFAESSAPGGREQRLTLLFSGVLETLNTRRRDYIDTIRRFSRHQSAVAAQVEGLLNELAALEDKTGEDADARHRELKETVGWHQRVFEQREKSILALCEQPVAVEQTLGDLARVIAGFLD